MFNKQLKLSIFLFFIFFLYSKIVFSQVVKDIVINGNDRIPSETILMFSNVKIKDDINENKLNLILKDLYNSNFFEDVSINFENNVLRISVIELPVIENITYNGIKAQKVKDAITKNLKLRSRSSYDKIILIDDNNKIISVLRDLGYYFASIDTFIE